MHKIRVILSFLIISLSCASCRNEKEKTDGASDSTSIVTKVDTTWYNFNSENEFLGLGKVQFGDLDSMVQRRRIRVLVPYTHFYYAININKRSGVAFEVLTLFENSLNKQLHLKPNQVRIIFIPVNRSQIIPLLQEGYADFAYAGMTITEERKKKVDFSIPSITGLKEIVVGGPKSPKLNSLADLSGKEIYLREGSSYESAALKLNDSLKNKGLKPIIIKTLDPYLETEDVLEMVHSGVIPFSAMVEDIAELWSKVMPNLVLYNKIPLARNISYGIVFRKNSPKLKAAVDTFLEKNSKGTLIGNTLYNKYVKNANLLPQIYTTKTFSQVNVLKAPFLKYADRYQLDWLLLIAQGYQESGLNQALVSNKGAVGIMQVLPTTAASKPFYIRNINKIDNNVHAGVKYMRFLIDRYFSNPDIDELNRHLLALAAYNAGPSRVAQLREIAKSKGLNPNLWFDNVELIAAKEIGQETVQYVSNIYKFYASYRALDYYAEQRGKKLRP
ncbi:transglycosylase SLT domain-containing protein [Flavobacterium aquidurense]|uniref:transglycosylase SLT domain-containing protein n=1 Tax=Flavobacterium aquidurense TaxID=362413 RepID=UPI002858383F|nr:transporter substrate-binding domain-containing protein [Flavobacterium aquidurense]MDR7371400.1 membrane-bound lytic murein transglycosylase MltF [Flavobacterium aquidurense]